MGFWDYPAKGIGTPSANWMGELLTAQQAGGDLPPHQSSIDAAVLPDPPLFDEPVPRARRLDRWRLEAAPHRRQIRGRPLGTVRSRLGS